MPQVSSMPVGIKIQNNLAVCAGKVEELCGKGSEMNKEVAAVLSYEKAGMEEIAGEGVEKTSHSVSFTGEAYQNAVDEVTDAGNQEDVTLLHRHPTNLMPSNEDIDEWTSMYEETGKNDFPIMMSEPDGDGVFLVFFDHMGNVLKQRKQGELCDVSRIENGIIEPFCSLEYYEELGNMKFLLSRGNTDDGPDSTGEVEKRPHDGGPDGYKNVVYANVV